MDHMGPQWPAIGETLPMFVTKDQVKQKMRSCDGRALVLMGKIKSESDVWEMKRRDNAGLHPYDGKPVGSGDPNENLRMKTANSVRDEGVRTPIWGRLQRGRESLLVEGHHRTEASKPRAEIPITWTKRGDY